MAENNFNPEKIRFKTAVLGGLIAITFIITQDFISASSLDLPEFVSILSFSISLPLLGMALLFYQLEIRDQGSNNSRIFPFVDNLCVIIGMLCTIIGVIAAFWHVTWIAGLVFLVVSLVMLALLIVHTKYLS